MQKVNVGHKSLADYNSLIGRTLAEEIRRLAEPMQGKRILHLSATAFGGGVAEIQYTLIPLMIDAGLDAEWRVIEGRDEFYDVTKAIHNALQGDDKSITDHQKAIFEVYNKLNADALTDADEWDVIVVHDPQPLAMREYLSTHPAALGVALPHRPVDAQPRGARVHRAQARGLRRVHLPHARVRAARRRPPRGGDLAAGDRPARTQEHGPLDRRCRLHRGSVRHRRRAAAAPAGIPLRPLEGPGRRDRCLPDGQGAPSRTSSWRWSDRWRTTIPRAGTSGT